MHWYNVFTVIVAAGAAILTAGLSYFGTQRATRRQLQDALAARLAADEGEHRRWLRDRSADIYIDLLQLRTAMFNILPPPLEYLPRYREYWDMLKPLVESPTNQLLLARVQALGDPAVKEAAETFFTAMDSLLWFVGDAMHERLPRDELSSQWAHNARRIEDSGNNLQQAIRAVLQTTPTDSAASTHPRPDSNKRSPVPETGAPSAEQTSA